MRWTLPLLLALTPLAATQAVARDGLSITLVSGRNTNTASYNSNGNDWTRVQSLRQGNQPLLYVRKGDAGYVIRDAAVLAQVAAIMKPQQDLGARQGALGGEQGALGTRQGALGAQQARLGGAMAARGPRGAEALAAQMRELGRQQAELGEQQRALGQRQAALGEQQSRLASLARPKLEAVVADAIRRGLAKRVE